MALVVLLQMVFRAMLALVAASLIVVASAAAPDINVVVGNFALNLVSIHAPACWMHSHTDMSEPKTRKMSQPNRLNESRKDLSDLQTRRLCCMQRLNVVL